MHEIGVDVAYHAVRGVGRHARTWWSRPAAIMEAVTVYRELARVRPDAFLPDLAT